VEAPHSRYRVTSTNAKYALRVVLLHTALVAGCGEYYAKLSVVPGLYVTEVALAIAMFFGYRAAMTVPRDTLTKFIFVFVTTGVLWALATGMNAAGVKAMSFFVYSSFYFIVRTCAATEDERWRFLEWIVIASVFGMLIGFKNMHDGVLSLAGDTPAEEWTTSTGSTRWLPGEFALYGMFGVIVVGMREFLQPRDRTALVKAIPAFVVLVLAQHRSGFLALATALLGTALFLTGSRRIMSGLFKLVVIAVIGGTLFVVITGSNYVDATIERLQHTFDLTEDTAAWRLLSWYEVGMGIVDAPWGHGFATWDFLFNMDDPLRGSHNSFLDLTYRVGIQGLAVFIGIIVSLVIATRQELKRRAGSNTLQLVIICACIFAWLTFAFFNVVFDTPYLSIFFWVLLGLAGSAVDDNQPRAT
jgi:hypothetical protein